MELLHEIPHVQDQFSIVLPGVRLASASATIYSLGGVLRVKPIIESQDFDIKIFWILQYFLAMINPSYRQTRQLLSAYKTPRFTPISLNCCEMIHILAMIKIFQNFLV